MQASAKVSAEQWFEEQGHDGDWNTGETVMGMRGPKGGFVMEASELTYGGAAVPSVQY
jgi:hypothetical protein